MIFIQEITAEQTWPIRQQVMWPDKSIDFVKIKGDERATHYGLYHHEILISVVSCFEHDDEMQFRKFATLKEFQNKGFGSMLLNHLIDQAKLKGISRLWCNARYDKKTFYEKFGLRTTPHKFIKEHIEYVIMEINLS